MKIVEVIPELNLNDGAETFVYHLSSELSKNNNIVIIGLYKGLSDKYSSLMNNPSIKILFCYKKRGLDLNCYRTFRKLLLLENPDVVHTHLSSLVTYFFSFGFAKTKWKLFHTCHNIASKECNGINIIIRKMLLLFKRVTIVAISNAIKDSLSKMYGDKYKYPIIYNATKLCLPKIHNRVEYTFITAARFNKEKNHAYLLYNFAKFLKEYPNVSLCCLGDGILLNDIKELSIQLGINSNVYFYGQVNNVYPYLLKSMCFVLPSLYEGNPISIIEAIDCCLPIIASSVGGIPDIISNNINGILIDPMIEDSLYEAMKKIYTDNSFRKYCVCNNEILRSKYNIKNCALEYLRIFTHNE